ncbi:M14 family metallopeptidase [Flavobacterium pallidum]|uniref:Peptidase M14 n=1 Tax=Flavobacterium pallidum TaxID=2172098 RepID=A0A2S1SKP1_9FLAO|nr:M14 metallopeptidase family protein [Flavobacterium pallidum]AWI26907.1 peptidase M14 [Flavobacterium pallidum]
MDYEKIFADSKQEKLHGRYICNDHIEPILETLSASGSVEILGQSVSEKNIYGYRIGHGKTKILAWSQMHGNESTCTKALFDFFNFLSEKSAMQQKILSEYTFQFIPILNPDGAEAYTRVNANDVDLNRDAQDQSQPESVILRKVYDTFRPDYCYNMHDQRTIFGVADTGKPATVSFLAPSFNAARDHNEVRLKAIKVINAMDKTLQEFIPGQVGRFDDGFNINCVGDTFQFLGTPTILFEAGHFQGDYEREITRKYVFFALLSGLKSIHENVIVNNEIDYYLIIPQNNPNFFDFVYKNIKINYDSSDIITNFAAQYKEELVDKTINFNAFVVKIGNLDDFFGHSEFDGGGAKYSDIHGHLPQLDQKADFFLDGVGFVNGSSLK